MALIKARRAEDSGWPSLPHHYRPVGFRHPEAAPPLPGEERLCILSLGNACSVPGRLGVGRNTCMQSPGTPACSTPGRMQTYHFLFPTAGSVRKAQPSPGPFSIFSATGQHPLDTASVPSRGVVWSMSEPVSASYPNSPGQGESYVPAPPPSRTAPFCALSSPFRVCFSFVEMRLGVDVTR